MRDVRSHGREFQVSYHRRVKAIRQLCIVFAYLKLFQIDDSHYIFLRSDSWVDGVLNGEGAGIDSRGCQLWDNLSQGKNI